MKMRHPATWVPTAYFAEGLPFVVINIVASIMYARLGKGDAEIALWTSLIILPYSLKPLWSPFLEMFKTKKYFVLITQFITAVSFGLAAAALPFDNFFLYSLVAFAIVSFSGSTHDIAVDGIYVNALSPKQQAQYVGWQGAFYNLAKVLSMGAFMWYAGKLTEYFGEGAVHYAWMVVMGTFGFVMLLLGLWHTRMLPSGGEAKVNVTNLKDSFSTFGDVIKTFFTKQYIGWGILFMFLYRFAEGQAIKIAPLFMVADRTNGGLGLNDTDFGTVYGTAGPIAFLAGSILGGYFVAGRGLRKSRMILAAAFNFPFAAYAFLAITVPTSLWTIGGAVVFEYFGYGFGFVGLTLYMMQQIAPGKYKMAHYAFATSLMNLGVMIPSMVSGYLSDWMGYKTFFIYVLIATIPSFLITWLVPYRKTEDDEAAEAEAAAAQEDDPEVLDTNV